jgi:septal ring factor EnvC (AmiA/AmiB activator)
LAALVAAFCMALPAPVLAQSKKELEDKRKKIIRDIETTQRMIQKTAKNKEAAYDRYLALRKQVESREALIRNLQAELVAADDGISRNQAVIASMSNDVAKMREEYGKAVRAAFRRKTLSNPLLYLLSAESLNQAFRRWLFLRKYDQRRREQAEAIRLTQEMLSKKAAALTAIRTEKEQLLLAEQAQKAALSGELSEKNALLQELKKDETRLKADLDKKKAAHEALNSAIEAIIQEEVRKRVEEARSKAQPAAPKAEAPEKKTATESRETAKPLAAATEKETVAKPNTSEDAVSFNFRKNKGKLPWPVENGFIARGYGKQPHPTLKNIEITNNGIDIRTEDGASVRCVAEGRVAGVQFVPGHDYTVIVQHGDFYTVYTNLSATSLSTGDEVRARQHMGQVATNNITGTSELHFEVWQQKERMNPIYWLKK